jgi:hypothetical protein
MERIQLHFQGQQLISRETIFTGRTILTICVARIIIWLIDYSPDKVNVLGQELDAQYADKAIMYLLIALCFSHLIHWWGDFSGRFVWNRGDKFGDTGMFDQLVSPQINAVQALSKEINGMFDVYKGKADVKQVDALLKRLTSIESTLNNISRDMFKFNWNTKFQLFGWYLAVPLCLSIFTIYLVLVTPHCL